MRHLLDFILKYSHCFLFVILEVVCFVLLFRFNSYQGSVYISSANCISGTIYEISHGITGYFHLRDVNDTLTDRNLDLECEIAALRSKLYDLTSDSVMVDSVSNESLKGFTRIKAHVVNNSLNRADNFITIDRGESDGVNAEMGVVCGKGVVGIVSKVAFRHALVISLLNSRSNISCKIKNRGYFGYLRWDGKDVRYTYLCDLPRHAECIEGDTIVTSGHSSIFPEGLMVGIVEKIADSHDGLSYLLKIKLATNFSRLNDVRVISRNGIKERKELELSILKEKSR